MIFDSEAESRSTGYARSAIGLRMELSGGACLEISDESQAVLAAQLLRALEGSPRPC